MKKIIQLKKLLDFVIVFSAIIIGVLIIAVLFGLVTNNLSSLKFTIQGNKIEHIDTNISILIIACAIGYSFFIGAILKLKKLVNLFVEKHYFSNDSVQTLKIIGMYFLASTLLINLSVFIYNVFSQSSFEFKISTLSPDSMLFSIIISLFFIILSYIFNEAKKIKEENELTI